MGQVEGKIVVREKDVDKDIEDVVEYVKWITADLG
jgi:hypothetical protein